MPQLYLIRHGEVHNPDHVVYADLPGFGLSTSGRSQAEALADHLADAPIARIVTSPLLRATETAAPLADRLGLEPIVDDRLTEWRLSGRWAGTVWEELPDVFPGELEAYLAHPDALAFTPEPIAEVAERMRAAAEEHLAAGPVAIVSHQDPVQALRLHLLGRPLSELQRDKPGHASVSVLRRSDRAWVEERRWAPPQQDAFPPTG